MNPVAGSLVLLLACIGNAELWVALINRRHALRYRHCQLRRIRSFHDVGIVVFPPLILVLAGIGQGGLLRGGTVSALPWPVQGMLYVTLAGVIPFVFEIVRRRMTSQPRQLVDVRSQCFDIRAEADSVEQQRSIEGQSTRLSRFPGNQIFELEVNQKRLQLTTETRCTDVLRIAHFTDTHLYNCPGREYFERVTDKLCELNPDIFCFTGDLLDSDERLPWAVEMFERMRSIAPGYFILGNHDWHLDHRTARQQLADTGWCDLGEKSVSQVHNGVKLTIAGTEAPWIGENPVVASRSDEQMRLLLSHTPDQRDFGVANDFDLMLCGHNHGGQIVLPIVGPVYSPSRYGVRYAGGLFHHRGMLMHVSRGVGAKDTVRWNCRPEITLLEIQGLSQQTSEARTKKLSAAAALA